MNSLDLFVKNYFSTVRTPFVTDFMYILSGLFDVTDFICLSRFVAVVFCVSVLIYLFRDKRHVVLFVLALLFGAIFSTALKYIFNVARPLGPVMFVSGPSFPSYHATVSTVFFTILIYAFDDYFNRTGRIIFYSICIIGIILISVSRLYLSVHWLSDVIGGIVLGALVSHISVKVFKYFSKLS